MDSGENLWGERPHAGKPAQAFGFASSEGIAGNIGLGGDGEPHPEILECAQEIERRLGHVMDVINADVDQGLKRWG